ncbi:hypothetical protein SNOG_02428 [Parastagonospora nodorum SN15]|uniref:Uncharacterized protein n=1 Tax=Phaeosphaeria nodorum (strain SN15 / ATCC MYA-4574 / FGSC 10173) TaxID=321614 RepID=Q0V0N6_PHANO|nr:hypothetical protein SNOG_02428 [Parastagonospora nodorum SN15]EAT90640.1 hypothetical protein SNOG_02428 [Parastagonospora nodorum SN15]
MAKDGGSWQLAVVVAQHGVQATYSQRCVRQGREHNTNTVASVGFGEKVFFLGLYLGSPSDATLLEVGNFRGVTEVTCASECSVWDWIQQA